jgi:hypothetical protein
LEEEIILPCPKKRTLHYVPLTEDIFLHENDIQKISLATHGHGLTDNIDNDVSSQLIW